MTKPTILYIIGQLNRGGAEQQLHELLSHSDFNAIVLSLAHGGYWAGPLREKGIPVIELKREGHLELRRLWQTAQVIRKIQPDLIHIALDGRTALYPRLGMILAGYKNPVLAEQRSHPTYYPGWFRRLMPLLNRRVDAIVSTSYSAHEYLVGHRLATEAQSCVIPSGINTARFHDPALREGDWPWPDEWRGKLIVGTVGHLTEAKSPETFIQTAARVRETHPDVRFALIGSGPLEGDLRQLIDMLGVGDTVWLAGERIDALPNSSDDPAVWQRFEFEACTAPGAALLHRAPAWRPHGVRVLISDLMWPADPVPLLSRLAGDAAALTVIQVLADEEESPAPRGACRLEDVESGDYADLMIDTTACAAYAAALARHRESWSTACRACGASFVAVTAEQFAGAGRLTALETCGLLEVV